MENWKWIKDFEGVYQISDHGRLKSFKKNKEGTVLSNVNKNGGYLSVVLRGANGNRSIRIHQLVAECFIGEKPKGFQIHHIDGNKQNNFIENLAYISTKEHYKETILSNPKMLDGMINYNKIVKPKKVLQYTLDGHFVNRFKNSKDASMETGICQRNILQVASFDEYKPGKTRSQAGGFVWRFEK